MIPNIARKIKGIPQTLWTDIFIATIILSVAFLSFFLGRISVLQEERGQFQVIYPEGQQAFVAGATEPQNEENKTTVSESEKNYVASKTGSKYHFPWCSGAKAIKEENKVYFATKAEAERAGYDPAANCKGL